MPDPNNDPKTKGMHEEASQDSYDPSDVAASRSHEQGLGMGQEDLDRQQSPTRAYEEDASFQSNQDVDLEEPASGGAQQGRDRTKFPEKEKAWSQGRKTIAKNKDIMSRRT